MKTEFDRMKRILDNIDAGAAVEVATKTASIAERGIFWTKTAALTFGAFCILLIVDIVVRIVT